MDVEHLQHLHRYTRKDAGKESRREVDFGVGHEDIEANKNGRHQNVGHHRDKQTHHRTDDNVFLNVAGESGHHNRHARRDNDDDGYEEEHGQIVCHGAKQTAWMLHLPDFVEGFLDVADEHQHGEEHEKQSDAKKDSAFGVHQVRVDKADDGIGGLRLARECVSKPNLNVF